MIQGEKASAILREEARLVAARIMGLPMNNPCAVTAEAYLRELMLALEAGADALRDRDYNGPNFRRTVNVREKLVTIEDLLE